MKTITVPRDMRHVRRDGMRFCVLCQHLCRIRYRCPCCKLPA